MDNEPDWPWEFEQSMHGEQRDRYTDSPYGLYPNPYVTSTGLGEEPKVKRLEDFLQGVGFNWTNEEGPNPLIAYIDYIDYFMDQETVLNRWIKPGGPLPHPTAEMNLYEKRSEVMEELPGYYTNSSNERISVLGNMFTYMLALSFHEGSGVYLVHGVGSGHYAVLDAQSRFTEANVYSRLERLAAPYDTRLGTDPLGLLAIKECQAVCDIMTEDPQHIIVRHNYSHLLLNGVKATIFQKVPYWFDDIGYVIFDVEVEMDL